MPRVRLELRAAGLAGWWARVAAAHHPGIHPGTRPMIPDSRIGVVFAPFGSPPVAAIMPPAPMIALAPQRIRVQPPAGIAAPPGIRPPGPVAGGPYPGITPHPTPRQPHSNRRGGDPHPHRGQPQPQRPGGSGTRRRSKEQQQRQRKQRLPPADSFHISPQKNPHKNQ